MILEKARDPSAPLGMTKGADVMPKAAGVSDPGYKFPVFLSHSLPGFMASRFVFSSPFNVVTLLTNHSARRRRDPSTTLGMTKLRLRRRAVR